MEVYWDIFVIELVLSAVEMQLLLRFYSHVYGLKSRVSRRKVQVMGAAVMLIITCVLRVLRYVHRSVSAPLYSVLASLVLLPCFSGVWRKKTLFTLILIGLSANWTSIYDLVTTPSPLENTIVIYSGNHLVFWLLLEAVKRFGVRDEELPPSRWLLLSVIAGGSILMNGIIQWGLGRSENPYATTTEVPVLLAFLLINIALFILVDTLARKSREQAMLEQQLLLQAEHYRQMESYHDRVRALHHDMKNHISAAMQLAGGGGDNQVLAEYLQAVYGRIEQISQTISTGNPGLDSILNLKVSQLRYAGVAVEVRAHIPAGLTLPFDDGVVIFGNLLDNAREACEALPESKRWAKLALRYSVGALYIQVDNGTSQGRTLQAGAWPESTKQDALPHGYGLRNVRLAVERRGTMTIVSEEAAFSVRIVLYDL